MDVAQLVPDPLELAVMRLVLAPWERLTAPRFYGLEHLAADRPVVLAGNHTIMGLLDAPLMVLGLRERRGIAVRSLGDHLHFRIPGWRTLLEHGGVVEGTPEHCRALMRAGETILVFPGGAREVFKRKGEKYHLLWGERLGFVRLAVEHGYPIVPFGAVGAEECFDILLDAGDVLSIPLLGNLLARFVPRIDELPPLVRGVGPTLVPRPERFYFAFGPPIETRRFAGNDDDDVVCAALRNQVRGAVETEIAFLLAERRRDPDRSVVTRAFHWLGAPFERAPAARDREARPQGDAPPRALALTSDYSREIGSRVPVSEFIARERVTRHRGEGRPSPPGATL